MELQKIDVLDKGYVILHDTLGSDLTAVNSARVSFNKQKKEVDQKDERLIKFLAEHDHTSPFRHSALQFEVYAPLMVARQWWKYVIGSDHRDPFLAWNESSRRYITESIEFYIPDADQWRYAPEDRKQGSGEFIPAQLGAVNTHELLKLYQDAELQYERALNRGVCVEQARLFLPAYSLYVRWYWTASLQSVSHFLNQRLENEAQYEIRQYAEAVKTLSEKQFPTSMEGLIK